MKNFKLSPEIVLFDKCQEFCKEFNIGEKDLIITNEYIYKPYFESYVKNATVIYRRDFGSGEPNDKIVDAIYQKVKNIIFLYFFIHRLRNTVIIKTSNENGYGYIETKSLDGETNLKEKASLEAFRNISEDSYYLLQGVIECDRPNENLNQWNGKVITTQQRHHEGDGDNAIYCKMANMILKGCVLKNTNYVCGIVIYSGKNTKIMKNGKSARFKMSKVLNTMNKLLYSVFIFEIILCVVYGYLCLNWNNKNEPIYTYIFIVKDTHNPFTKFIINMFTCFVSYSQMIPISLYVVLEIIKIIQGFLVF